MIRQLATLWLGTLAIWLVLAGAAWLLAGADGVLDTVVACVLCLVPMTATLVWAHSSLTGPADQQLLTALGGTGVRLMVVIAGGIGLFHGVPQLHRPGFLMWVIVFYLTTLTLEIATVVRRQNLLADELPAQTQPTPTLSDPSGLGR